MHQLDNLHDFFPRHFQKRIKFAFALLFCNIFVIYRMLFFFLTLIGIYLFLIMDGWKILKRWATYWQRREPETVALRHLSSHFSITLTLTATPISGSLIQLPSNPAFLLIWDFRKHYSPRMLLGHGKPLPECFKGTTLQPFSLHYSIL